jgi:biopolymer transport protein ExbD
MHADEAAQPGARRHIRTALPPHPLRSAPEANLRMASFALLHVVFVLFIIAMVMTPSLTGGWWNEVTAATAVPVSRELVRVVVPQNGATAVWSPQARVERVRKGDLAGEVRRAVAAARPGPVLLFAEQSTPYAAVLDALGAMRQAGVRDVVLAADCPRHKESLMRHCFP